eukprot:TRINITY_DN3338_c0_g2_i2.p1 TRINITY_DN3338_c0_g2~~TRINITY_DN3338_c0_g2_i2.p1  ORF type:complete len:316 (+),score=21.63 TRINITY_DN3338_c0_g2_i2:412-1359(+)
MQNKEKILPQRDIDRDLNLSRDSPSREIVNNLAKKRALERREREKQRENETPRKKEPRILERTLKCIVLNGLVFWLSIFLFQSVVLPCVKLAVDIFTVGSSDALWTYTEPVLSFAFNTLWVLPFFLLSKIVNAIWFQDIADLAFQSTDGRTLVNLSISVMLADTVISILIEVFFLVQAKIVSLFPIEVVGHTCNFVHQCLLHSLYSFEYKWFSQGIELHKRLDYIEINWPYFLGFGLPLAVLTSLPSSQIYAGCVFSIAFPLFIVAGSQGSVVSSPGMPRLNIFAPTLQITNLLFAKTIQRAPTVKKTNIPRFSD